MRLWNKGTGPLFIKTFTVEDKNSLIDLMPIETRKLTYVEFIDTISGRVITPGDNLNILEFKIREDENGKPLKDYEKTLEKIKQTLDGVTIYIEYTNIYKDLMKYYSPQLDFGSLVKEDQSVDKIIETQIRRKNQMTDVKSKNSRFANLKSI